MNRPFDDLTQDRIYLETDAILSIISHCREGKWTLIASGIIDYELSKLPDMGKLEQVQMLYAVANERVALTVEAEQRAAFFHQHGLKPFDSLHLALAERSEVDVFLTTDDHLLRSVNKMDVKVKVAHPVFWLMEVMNL